MFFNWEHLNHTRRLQTENSRRPILFNDFVGKNFDLSTPPKNEKEKFIDRVQSIITFEMPFPRIHYIFQSY